MAGLIIKLAPGEQLYINGVLVTNGNRRCHITIQPPATVLLARHLLSREEARLSTLHEQCYLLQRILIGEEKSDISVKRITALVSSVNATIARLVEADRLYDAFMHLRKSLPAVT